MISVILDRRLKRILEKAEQFKESSGLPIVVTDIQNFFTEKSTADGKNSETKKNDHSDFVEQLKRNKEAVFVFLASNGSDLTELNKRFACHLKTSDISDVEPLE
eukprot:m.352 g.352  ORF g.352 m.352 type:complete len:104 (+) comp1867_c0_seq1:211-522(+)